MVYVERAPGADLRPWIRSMWYCCAPEVPHARERVLPNGCMQVLVNLAAESLTDCGDDGKREVKTSGALVMGARSRYEIVATKDMAEIAGVVIEPGGFAGMFGMRADLLRGSSASLDEVWSGTGGMLAERLREAEGGEGEAVPAGGTVSVEVARRGATIVDGGCGAVGDAGARDDGTRVCARDRGE